MKAILINPENQTIEEVNIEKGINAMYELMGCDLVGAPVVYDNGDTMYCDDEGLFKEQKGGFMMPRWTAMIVGKVLVIGCDENTGESADVLTPVNFFRKSIMWKTEEEVKRYQEHFV